MGQTRLILADIHPLEPFIVRSYQFSCRAVSFARHWPGPVELWLPGPPVGEEVLPRRVASTPPGNFILRFGPPPYFQLLWKKVVSRARFRDWVASEIRRIADSGNKALCYFRTLNLAHALLPVLRGTATKFVFEPHEVFHETARKADKLKAMEEAVYGQAAALFPITHALEARLRGVFPNAGPMLTGPLGHTGAQFGLPPYDPQAAPSLLYVGSLHKWKGLDTAFEASAGLGVPFDVVGDAGGLERCREFCRERGFTHVTFHGQVPPEQALKFYAPGCICLLPLSNEEIARSFTSPLKIFEYMAAGRPIVAGDVPSIRELVKDGEQARLISVGDAAAWRRALEGLMGDRATATRLANNARQLARACTWEERAKPLAGKMQMMAAQSAPDGSAQLPPLDSSPILRGLI